MINLLPLPDLVGMLILMGVLAWARTKYQDHSVNLWLVGLGFVFLEGIAVAFYQNSQILHLILHAVALDSYLLAAFFFSIASGQNFLPGRLRVPLLLLPVVPMFVISTAYGLERGSFAFYFGIAIISIASGLLYILFAVRADRPFKLWLTAIHLILWMPMAAMAHAHSLRWMVYYGLGSLYLLVAASFRSRVRRDGMGGVVIVSGFIFWAACLLLHPLVRGVELYGALFSLVWNMQKFLVIIGMLLVLLEDQTRRREREAMHDPLTGLPNRRLFEDRLTQALERSRRLGTSLAVLVLDLNGFKQINDAYGHREGDLVLKDVARELFAKVRGSDTLARFGGDEFTVLVADVMKLEDYEIISKALRASVVSVGTASGGRFELDCSIGFARFPQDASDGAKLCEVADLRMYEEKHSRLRQDGADELAEAVPVRSR